MSTRRTFLRGTAAFLAGSALGAPAPSWAMGSNGRKLACFQAFGGWDTTKIFVSPFGIEGLVNPYEDVARERTANGITYIDHPNRPAVRAFFENYGQHAAVVNGVLVRSVNHGVCGRLILTGSSVKGRPDWPSIIAAAAADAHALPSIVLSGYMSSGPLHRYASLIGDYNQLQKLIDRDVFNEGDQPIHPPPDGVFDKVDALLAERVGRRLDEPLDVGEHRMLDTMDDGLGRVTRLRGDADAVEFRGGPVPAQVKTAVSMLREGIARCVTLSMGPWVFDYHAFVNDQDVLIDAYFVHLMDLVDRLAAERGELGGTLLDETTIFAVSEMGRTPFINGQDGKDHWPYTCCMLIGGGIRGAHMIGGHDAHLNGLPVNFATGQVDQAGGTVILPTHIGSTLLTIAGIDPEIWVPGAAPLASALAL